MGALSAPPNLLNGLVERGWARDGPGWREDAGGGRAELRAPRSRLTAAAKPHEGDCSWEIGDIGFMGTSHCLSRLGQNKSKSMERHPCPAKVCTGSGYLKG